MFNKLKNRLSDRNKAPYKWWFPEKSIILHPSNVIAELHEDYSKSINKTMLTLLVVGMYCLVTITGSTDLSLITPTTTITAPLIGSKVPFTGFLIVAPTLLIALTIYLHILLHYWGIIEQEYKQFKELNKKNENHIKVIPTIFNFDDPFSRFFTNVIFYWFPSIILWVISWKAFARTEFIKPLFIISFGTTLTLALLCIRNTHDNERFLVNIRRWMVLCLFICGILYTFLTDRLHRPLHLERENLQNAWLRGLDMSAANFSNANLEGAELELTNLNGAIFSRAKLTKANLTQARLQGADLNSANLKKAILCNADLSNANLWKADLTDANLTNIDTKVMLINKNDILYKNGILYISNLNGANLSGAFLEDANLRRANLAKANLMGANFSGAILSGSILTEADLREAIFAGADLTGADLRRAVFSEIKLTYKGTHFKKNGFTIKNKILNITTAKNWDKAYYSPNILKTLGLPINHNEMLDNEFK